MSRQRNVRPIFSISSRGSPAAYTPPTNAPAEVPANTFKGQTAPVKTVKAASNILVSADLSNETAYTITKTIIESVSRLPKIHAALGDFDPKMAADRALNGNCPLHPGAVKYYKEAGLMK